ncbi:hypothetical protein BgiBS90_002008 [Biomphalaria glabrata]|nr:hypothetical protein BgiBS90_002008 [Biomphalaria glabrata]
MHAGARLPWPQSGRQSGCYACWCKTTLASVRKTIWLLCMLVQDYPGLSQEDNLAAMHAGARLPWSQSGRQSGCYACWCKTTLVSVRKTIWLLCMLVQDYPGLSQEENLAAMHAGARLPWPQSGRQSGCYACWCKTTLVSFRKTIWLLCMLVQDYPGLSQEDNLAAMPAGARLPWSQSGRQSGCYACWCKTTLVSFRKTIWLLCMLVQDYPGLSQEDNLAAMHAGARLPWPHSGRQSGCYACWCKTTLASVRKTIWLLCMLVQDYPGLIQEDNLAAMHAGARLPWPQSGRQSGCYACWCKTTLVSVRKTIWLLCMLVQDYPGLSQEDNLAAMHAGARLPWPQSGRQSGCYACWCKTTLVSVRKTIWLLCLLVQDYPGLIQEDNLAAMHAGARLPWSQSGRQSGCYACWCKTTLASVRKTIWLLCMLVQDYPGLSQEDNLAAMHAGARLPWPQSGRQSGCYACWCKTTLVSVRKTIWLLCMLVQDYPGLSQEDNLAAMHAGARLPWSQSGRQSGCYACWCKTTLVSFRKTIWLLCMLVQDYPGLSQEDNLAAMHAGARLPWPQSGRQSGCYACWCKTTLVSVRKTIWLLCMLVQDYPGLSQEDNLAAMHAGARLPWSHSGRQSGCYACWCKTTLVSVRKTIWLLCMLVQDYPGLSQEDNLAAMHAGARLPWSQSGRQSGCYACWCKTTLASVRKTIWLLCMLVQDYPGISQEDNLAAMHAGARLPWSQSGRQSGCYACWCKTTLASVMKTIWLLCMLVQDYPGLSQEDNLAAMHPGARLPWSQSGRQSGCYACWCKTTLVSVRKTIWLLCMLGGLLA